MTIVYFFTGMDLLVAIVMLLIPIYGMGLGIIDALAWITTHVVPVMCVLVGIFLIAGILVFYFTKEIEKALPLVAVVPLSFVNPVMCFVNLVSPCLEVDGFFMKMITITIAIFVTLVVAAISLGLLAISLGGFTVLFDSDADDSRSTSTFIIENVLIFIVELVLGFMIMS